MRRRMLFAQEYKVEIPEIIVDTNKIYYTTTDNNSITPYSTTALNVTLNSNAFDSSLNMYVITFSGDLT